ncbi:MAG: carbohydrate binding domain-containing protein, partial [Patescibacteria group bacterium]
VATAATSSNLNFQSRLLTSSGNTVADGNYHIEFKLYNANNTTGSSQGSCTGDSACLWTETRTTGNLVRVVNGYLTVNLGSVTAFPSTIDWDQEHWLGMRVGGSAGGASWETIELTTDGTATGGKLKLTAVPYAFKAGQLAKRTGANTSTLDFDTQTGARSILLPDASGTICLQGASACGFATTTGGAGYIQNQNGIQQTASNFWISGTGRTDTSLQAPLLDTATAVALNLGTTNATVINLNQNTTLAAGKTLTVTSALTSLTGDTTGDALNVSNSTSTGNIAVFKDNTTAVATIANGGATTFQNQTNSANAFQVQNAGGTQLFNIDSTAPVTNLITNSNFEVNTSGWSVLAGSTLTQDTSQYLFGTGSMKVDSASAADGAKYVYALSSTTDYVFSVYVKTNATSYVKENLQIGRSDDGSTNTACTTANTYSEINNSGWTRYYCKFRTGTVSGSPYVFIRHNSSALDFFVDGAMLEQTSNSEPSPYSSGKLTLNAQIASPLFIQPTQNSSSALQIQNAANETLLNVASDTFNMLANSSFENGSASPWVAMGGASLSSISDTVKWIGERRLLIDNSASANDGAKYPISLESNTSYIFSFYANSNITASSEIGHSSDGSTDSPCMQSPATNVTLKRFVCQFTTGTVSG